MTHQQRPEPVSLIVIDHNKGDLRLAGLCDDAASPADDDLASVLSGERDQGTMIDKIDVDEEGDLLLRKTALRYEEAPLQRLCASTADCRQHIVPIIGPQRANFNFAAIAQAFGNSVATWRRHRGFFLPSRGTLIHASSLGNLPELRAI